jgi:hypothetical protein
MVKLVLEGYEQSRKGIATSPEICSIERGHREANSAWLVAVPLLCYNAA